MRKYLYILSKKCISSINKNKVNFHSFFFPLLLFSREKRFIHVQNKLRLKKEEEYIPLAFFFHLIFYYNFSKSCILQIVFFFFVRIFSCQTRKWKKIIVFFFLLYSSNEAILEILSSMPSFFPPNWRWFVLTIDFNTS